MPVQRWDTPGAREVSATFTMLLGRVLRTSRPHPSASAAARADAPQSDGALDLAAER